MKPLRTLDDILQYATAHAPTNACARSIREGRAEVSALNGGGLPGWLVKVMNKSAGRCWKIIIRCDEETRTYPVEYA